MVWVFWLSVAAVLYVYAGYPILLRAWAELLRSQRGMRNAECGTPNAECGTRGVSIVVAARNEAARLPARIDNLLSLDYPADRRQIIVVSDGSTDAPAQALACFGDRVELVELPASGKAVALNAGVVRATGDILVFAAAPQSFARA